MSIEALIQAHTEALLANTEAVKLLTLSLAGRTPVKAEVVKGTSHKDASEDEIAGKKSRNSVVEEADPNATQAAEMAEHAAEVAANAARKAEKQKVVAVNYETVRALVLKLAPTQRDAIKALNAKHGIANLKVLLDKEDDFSSVNDQVKLEAVYADLQALEA